MVETVPGTYDALRDGITLLQFSPDLFAGPLGKLLIALVVIAVILFVGRYVMSVATRLIKIAIVIVAVIWLATVVAPMVGF